MQGDGNFVVYKQGGAAMFSSRTAPSSGDQLVMQNDGNLVIYASGGFPLWATNGGRTANGADTTSGTGSVMYAGQSIRSLNGRYTVMRHNGNFVEYGPNGAAWATGTGGVGDGVVARMQGDGNFVLYAPGSKAIYSTSTAPAAGTAWLCKMTAIWSYTTVRDERCGRRVPYSTQVVGKRSSTPPPE